MRKQRVLVCITLQSNGLRLIDSGHEIAKAGKGELHILHVEKGVNLATEATGQILQELFEHASQLGGTVHGICGEDVAGVIWNFIRKNRITHLVVGEPPAEAAGQETIVTKMKVLMPKLELVVVPRKTESIIETLNEALN